VSDVPLSVLVERVDDVITTLHRVEEQVIRTNGRVSTLEVEAKIAMAVAADRATRLASESELRNRQVDRAVNRRQWVVNTAVAVCGIGGGLLAALLATH
jgi:hypothetical protein